MNNIVKIITTDDKEILVEIMPEYAPLSAANFLKLVEEKYYDGCVFHRIINQFMIQTGGYYIKDDTLMELPEKKAIKGEFSSNGINNELKHLAGTISMARTNIKDSATTQFFICSVDCPHLDGEYAAFGKVVDEESLNNVIEISKKPTGNLGGGFQNFPYDCVGIKSISIIK